MVGGGSAACRGVDGSCTCPESVHGQWAWTLSMSSLTAKSLVPNLRDSAQGSGWFAGASAGRSSMDGVGAHETGDVGQVIGSTSPSLTWSSRHVGVARREGS